MKLADLPPVNLPDLIARHCGPDGINLLHRERGGVIRDPRPGHSETRPSFSVYRNVGVWRWKRHGGDEASGNAYGFLLELGYSKRQAVEELHRLAGVPLDGWQVAPLPRIVHIPPSPLELARGALDRCGSLTEGELNRAWASLSPSSLQDAAGLDLQRRGLYGWPGLQAGRLRYDFSTREGRRLAQRGALAFFLSGPDGQLWGLKVRNLGTSGELYAAGIDRYVYRIARHGAPTWCSPDYGQGTGVLIAEGELNGAAAARALEAVGVDLDVQGLAGAGGTPFLDGLKGKPVFLYADPDPAGLACLERVGKLAQAAGASEVRVLAPLAAGDFCDLLGRIGATAFGAWLEMAFKSAQRMKVDLGPRSDLGPADVPRKMLSGTVPSIWGRQNKPCRAIWGNRRGLL